MPPHINGTRGWELGGDLKADNSIIIEAGENDMKNSMRIFALVIFGLSWFGATLVKAQDDDDFVVERAAVDLPSALEVPAVSAPLQPAVLDAAGVMAAASEPLPAYWADESEVRLPPGLSVFDAVTNIIAQLPDRSLNYLELMGSNDLARIQESPSTFYTEKPMYWRDVMKQVLQPVDLDYMEDGAVIKIATREQVDLRYRKLEEDRLRSNRVRIPANFQSTQLSLALDVIRRQAGVVINKDFMPEADRKSMGEGLTAQEIAASTTTVKTTSFSLAENETMPWRDVLTEVLAPSGYDFVEVGGVVRILTKDQAATFREDMINEKPLITRLVRVYHAAPADIVKRLDQVKGLKVHRDAFYIESRSFGSSVEANSKRFSGTSLSSAGTAGEGSQIGADVRGVSGFGSMERPRTPPGILIGDINENLDRIEKQIRMLDVRERQVLIEAKIFEISDNSLKNIGINWETLGGNASFDSQFATAQDWGRNRESGQNRNELSERSSATSRDDDFVAGTSTRTSMGTEADSKESGSFLDWSRTFDRATSGNFSTIINPLQFSLYWEAVQRANDFKLVSQPVVVIGDHAEAVIRVGNIEPAFTQTTTVLPEGGSTQGYEWTFIQTGISLWVIPEISPDGGKIRLSIHPQQSDATGFVSAGPGGAGGRYPVLSIKEVDTRVSVPDGHTLIMGGLIQAEDGQEEVRVPLLGDIPYLGRLFRWNSNNRTARNLMILMTPTILDYENPETGYEGSHAPYLNDLTRGLGRDLGQQKIPDVNDEVKKRRKIRK